MGRRLIPVVYLLLLVPLGSEAQDRPSRRVAGKPEMGGEKVGFVPLCDMTKEDRYKGEDGGLYGEGRNEPPEAHARLAAEAACKVQRLDAQGKPSPEGKIVLVSIGMSNTSHEFSRFEQLAAHPRDPSPWLVIVNGAQGGQDAPRWSTPDAKAWSELDARLKAAGASPAQVQAVWIKQALAGAGEFGAFPAHAKKLQEELAKIVVLARARYPNLQIHCQQVI